MTTSNTFIKDQLIEEEANEIMEVSIDYISEEFIPNSIENIGNFNDIYVKIKEIDKLPITNIDIKFSSNTWDFTPIIASSYHKKLINAFNFDDVHEKYRDLCKIYVYYSVTQNKIKIHTLYTYCKNIFAFVNYFAENYIYSLESLDTYNIKKYLAHIKNRDIKDSSIHRIIASINDFLDFYIKKIRDGKDMSHITKEIESFRKTLRPRKSIKDEEKFQDIPNEYFNRYLSTAIKVMDSDESEIDMRGIAAFMVLISQTGLRKGQMRTLKINALTPVSILNGEKIAYFMKFDRMKNTRGNVIHYTGLTILNPLAYRAYNTLVEIYKKHREKIKTDILYTPTTITSAPISDNGLKNNMLRFCLRYVDELGCLNVSDKYPELSSATYNADSTVGDNRVIKQFNKKYKTNFKHNDVISYPTCHQFRVHLCTELYFKNIPLKVIQHYMDHLSEEMADYYVRRPEYSEKEEEFAKSVLKIIVEEGVKPLGGNSDALVTKINEFIKEGNFNVKKDIDTVISELKRKMPIKEKFGGICIKSGPRRDCSKDAATDEFYCAYNVCPNHFHLYTMTDITYNRCKTMLRALEHNEKNGFTRQAQKEKNKLIHVTKKSLLPELEQLSEVLEKKGTEQIKELHTNLQHIIDNLENIKMEANSWIQ